MSHGSVVHDPTGRWGTDLPLDREPNAKLAAKVLEWGQGDGTDPPRADIEQAALQLSGHAELLVRELMRETALLPRDSDARSPVEVARALAEVTIGEAGGRLREAAIRSGDGLKQAQSRALLVQALHGALDRVRAAQPAPVPAP